MAEHKIHQQQTVPRPLVEIFRFFSDARNLEALTPPWLSFRILEAPDQIAAGALIRYKLRVRGLPITWTTRILEWNPPHSFVDDQLSGPYALWHHTHKFTAISPSETLLEDIVRYKLPLDPLSAPVHWLLVRHDVRKIFDFRRRMIAARFGTAAPRP